MKGNRLLLIAAAAWTLAAAPAFAHHSFAAEYDANKPITLKGKVTQMEWINPHSWVHIDVTDENGKVANWACETAPPNLLYRAGWRKSMLKPGDEVVIEGYLAKDGSHTVNARSVRTPDGRKLFAGTSGDGGPPASENKK
ncbi:MAG TPA: DUF6152 family protein [Bryobacteraceae bacterium]|nr:DUF6152 family protein [Bryobacteraceae bacterium]